MPPSDRQRTEDVAAEPQEVDGPDLFHMSVLVVSSNAGIRKIICSMLMKLKVTRVLETATVSSAYAKLRETQPDFIIADYETQPSTGIDFVRWVRNGKDSPDRKIPIILVSGRTDVEAVRMARDVGIDEFIALPFSFNLLSERIRVIANGLRPFVSSRTYAGPDRRRRDRPTKGKDRRRQDGELTSRKL